MLYADDITYATSDSQSRAEIKTKTPDLLKKYNLSVNLGKTEESEALSKQHKAPPPPPPEEDPEDKVLWSELDWLIPPKSKPPEQTYTQTKLLGSKIGTKQDIKHRKTKVWQPMNTFKEHFKSKHLSMSHKMRTFNTYVETTFLYNAELWTPTDSIAKKIDSFHRRLLLIAINIK